MPESTNKLLGNPTLSAASSQPPSSPAVARKKLLLEGAVVPTMLRLAVPNVMNLLAFVGVIIFDGYFLGQIGTNALAGASLAFPFVMMVLHSSNSGMGAGVSSASFGLALGLVFACQGYGRGFGAMVANALRLCVNALGAVVAAYWLGFGLTGFCAAVAFGFVFYAALLCYNMQQIKDPIRPGAANDPK